MKEVVNLKILEHAVEGWGNDEYLPSDEYLELRDVVEGMGTGKQSKPILNIENINKIFYDAVLCGNQKLVEFLLDNGADPNAEYAKGFKPIHIAVISGYLQIVKLLVEKGHVNVNEECCFKEGVSYITRSLDINSKNANYKTSLILRSSKITILELATGGEHSELVDYLVNNVSIDYYGANFYSCIKPITYRKGFSNELETIARSINTHPNVMLVRTNAAKQKDLASNNNNVTTIRESENNEIREQDNQAKDRNQFNSSDIKTPPKPNVNNQKPKIEQRKNYIVHGFMLGLSSSAFFSGFIIFAGRFGGYLNGLLTNPSIVSTLLKPVVKYGIDMSSVNTPKLSYSILFNSLVLITVCSTIGFFIEKDSKTKGVATK